MSQFQEQLENLPGYDIVMDKYNDMAGEKFNTTDPFEDEDGNKRKLSPQFHTQSELRAWKRVQKLAWSHDRCFLGLCGVGLDCGIGLVPLAVFLLPGLGPIAMYVVHARLINIAQDDVHLPASLVAKMQANILVDFLISLPPVIGAYLSWMNGCLTRNAGMFYVYLEKMASQRQTGNVPQYEGTRGQPLQQPLYAGTKREQNYQKSSRKKNGQQESILVGAQHSGFR